MKIYTILTVSLMLIMFVSCGKPGRPVDKQKSGSYFLNSKGKIVYSQNGNWFELGVNETDADAKSFKVLSEDIGMDKDSVYYRGMAQKRVQRSSFYIDGDIPKDALHAFYIDYAWGLMVITGADPKTYEKVKDHINWTRDKDHYFYSWKMLTVDRNTFTFINPVFSQDKDSVYVMADLGKFQSIMPSKGPATAVNDQYIRIRNTIYFAYVHPEPMLRSNTFDSIRQMRSIANNVLLVNEKTLITYGEKFKYDKVDIASFQVYKVTDSAMAKAGFSDDRYSKDKNNVYYEGVLIKDADVNTYKPLYYGFGKDAKNAFYETNLLNGVDAASFVEKDTVFQDKLGNRYHYFTGEKM